MRNLFGAIGPHLFVAVWPGWRDLAWKEGKQGSAEAGEDQKGKKGGLNHNARYCIVCNLKGLCTRCVGIDGVG